MSNPAAKQRLGKGRQYLAAAEILLAQGLYDAAVSCAVLAGVYANDVICLVRLGRFSQARSHGDAIALARTAGPTGKQAATHLARLVGLKDKAQYDAPSLDAGTARSAIGRAVKLIEIAQATLSA